MIGRFILIGALLSALVYFLVKMGAPGWFAITFAGVVVGLTIAFLWPVLVVAVVSWILWKWVAFRGRRTLR